MFFTSPMRFLQVVVLEKDFQKTIDILGEFGCVELTKTNMNSKESNKNSLKEKFITMNETLDRIEKKINLIINFFDISTNNENGFLKDINDIEFYIDKLYNIILPYKETLTKLQQRKNELLKTINELSNYKNLSLSKKEMDNFEHFYFIIGKIDNEGRRYLSEKLKDRIIIIDLNNDLHIFFTSKKGRWSLETELKKINFKEEKFEIPYEDIPSNIIKNLNSELEKIEKEIDELNKIKNEIFTKEKNNIYDYILGFNLQKLYNSIYQNINGTDSIVMIEGWVLKKKINNLITFLQQNLGDNFSIVTYDPEELEEVKNGSLKVPVMMENFKFIKPFENIIFGYGVPSYKSIDPTIFVTLSFLTFFGMMYGDIGQGLIILLIGLFLQSKNKFKDIGFIISSVGFFSIIFGYLYGSIFCFEHNELKGLLTPINKQLFGINRPYIIDLSAENSINIFLVTLAFGVILNLLGMLINILNNIIKKTFLNIIFSPTGISGFIIELSIGLIGFELFVLKKNVSQIYVYMILIGFLLIFFKEPLTNLLKNHKPIFHEGFGSWIFLTIIELLEVILNFIGTNLSFIRIGAFAFAHAILSFTTIKLGELAGNGNIFTLPGIIVLIIGNSLIIGLEGMIVGIQTIRLEYYEFFSKFFTEQGKQFTPFKIYRKKLEEII